jgi:UDP:flavonoid glycosyltransferase YjiC (YdhE family)
VRALAALDVEVLLTATAADVAALGPVPPSVRALSGFPLRLLLPGCAAVVHHGGAGSTMTALWAGVPQLAVTFASEQVVNATRLAAAGAGIHLSGQHASVDRLRSAVSSLVQEEGYRVRAASLRTEALSRPSPAALVGTLAALVA